MKHYHNDTVLNSNAGLDSTSSGISTDTGIDLLNTASQPLSNAATQLERYAQPLPFSNDNIDVHTEDYIHPPPVFASAHDGIFPELTTHVKLESISPESGLLSNNDKDYVFPEHLNFIDEVFLRSSPQGDDDAYYATIDNIFLPSPTSGSDSDSDITVNSILCSRGSSSDRDTFGNHSSQTDNCVGEGHLSELTQTGFSPTCVSPNIQRLRTDKHFNADINAASHASYTPQDQLLRSIKRHESKIFHK